MLSNKEQKYHKVVAQLNDENNSPLKDKIIMGAEKKIGGIKGNQLISILDKVDVKNINGNDLDDNTMYRLIKEYLLGWENAVGIKITDRDPNLAPFSKVSGLRFMLIMLPYFYDQAVSERAHFNKDYISTKIKSLFSSQGMIPSDIFDSNSSYMKRLGGNPFAGETPTTNLANEWGIILKNMSSGDFNPLA